MNAPQSAHYHSDVIGLLWSVRYSLLSSVCKRHIAKTSYHFVSQGPCPGWQANIVICLSLLVYVAFLQSLAFIWWLRVFKKECLQGKISQCSSKQTYLGSLDRWIVPRRVSRQGLHVPRIYLKQLRYFFTSDRTEARLKMHSLRYPHASRLCNIEKKSCSSPLLGTSMPWIQRRRSPVHNWIAVWNC